MLRISGPLPSRPLRPFLFRVVVATFLFLVSATFSSAFALEDSYEPNNTLSDISANPNNRIPSGDQIESWISTESDVDLFWFELTETSDVEIALTSLPSDYDLCLFDLNDLDNPSCSLNPDAEDEFVAVTLGAGIYVIQVFPFEGFSASDSYLLQATYEEGGAGDTPPNVSLTRPTGGETWEVGSTQRIEFSATDVETPSQQLALTLEYSTNNGSIWNTVFENQPNTGGGSFLWTVPNTPTSSARIRMTASDGKLNSSAQSGTFSITAVEGSNLLSLSSGVGDPGTQVTLQLSLDNENPFTALQADLVFDAAIVQFLGVTAQSRASAFSDSSNVIAPGRARIVVWSNDDSGVQAGSGVIADLKFRLVGAGGRSSQISVDRTFLSHSSGGALQVSATGGVIDINKTGDPGDAPGLGLFALRNPGRPGTYQIFVTVVRGSGAAPAIQIGGVDATLSPLANGTYTLTHFLARGSGNATVHVSDTNGEGTGNREITISN